MGKIKFKNKVLSRIALIGICLVGTAMAASEQQVFKVGVIAPLSGSQKTLGTSVETAVRGALVDVNKYLKPYSAEVELHVEDSAGDPNTALASLESLHTEGIQIVIGPVLSSSVQKCLKFANSKGIVLISPTSTAINLRKSDYLFRMLPTDDLQAKALASFMAEKQISQVLPVYINDSYGKGLVKSFSKSMNSASILKGISFKIEELSDPELIDRIVAAAAELDSENGAVLFVGLGDVKTFFQNVSSNVTLKGFSWFASESLLASSPDLLDDSSISAFAVATKLATVSLHADDILFDLYGQYIYNTVKALMSESEQKPGHYIYPAWNSLWLAVNTSRLAAANEGLSNRQMVSILGEGDAFYGMYPLFFDHNGDRSNGKYYFLQPNATGTTWGTQAICEFNPNWANPRLKNLDFTGTSSGVAGSIKLHGLFSLTGSGGTAPAQKGFELALEHINSYASSLGTGTSFTSESYDTKTDPAVGLEIAQRVYNDEKARMIVGPCVSSVLANVVSGLPDLSMVSPTSTALSLAKSDDMVARLSPCDTAQADALTALINSDGVDLVVCVYRDDIWGKGIVNAFSSVYDGTVKSLAYSVDTGDFSDLIVELEELVRNNPAARKAVMLVSFDEGAEIFRGLDDLSPLLKLPWYGTDGLANSTAITQDDTVAEKAIEARFQCSTYSPKISDMLSPRLLLVNQWVNGDPHIQANPMTLLAYDSTWLVALAYLDEGAAASSDALWKRMNYQANLLTGFTYSNALDQYGDRSVKYYSFYRVSEGENSVAEWTLSSSYVDSGIGLKNLKRDGAVIDKGKSKLILKYKRNNLYKNGVSQAEVSMDRIKSAELPLGDCTVPEKLILDSGFMTGTLTVYVDGNPFPCVIEHGDWTVDAESGDYLYVTSKDKMGVDYFPMSLSIKQSLKTWSFQAKKISLDNLSWNDGLELRIDINRIPAVVINFKPEINLKLCFNTKKNGADLASGSSAASSFEKFGIDKLKASYSSAINAKDMIAVKKGTISADNTFDPVLNGVDLSLNDLEMSIASGVDWGSKTSTGLFVHKRKSNGAANNWLFDLNKQKWAVSAKNVNTIELANSFSQSQGLLVTLSSGSQQGAILLKPTVNVILKVVPAKSEK